MASRFYSFILLICLFGLSLFEWQETTPALRQGKDYALFIAVKDYDEWGDLRNPISDAEAIASELEKEYNFQTEIIRNPNRNTIYQTLESYQKKAFSEDSQLFIFFTGHGAFVEANSEGYFIPKDGKLNDRFQDTYVPFSRIKRMVNNINCNHILLALDACYSGTIDESLALGKGRLGQRPGAETATAKEAFIQKTLEHRSRLYITSGGKERTPDGARYSPFTEHLLKGFRDYSQRDGMLTFWELLAYLKNANPMPRHGEFGVHEPGGNFVFVSNSQSDTGETAKPNDSAPTQESDDAAWQFAANLNTKVSYEYYLKLYPEGKYQKEANMAILELSNKILDPKVLESLPKDQTGRAYRIVELDGKTWLAENLDYNIADGSWCYDDQSSNCREYGRLYTWKVAQEACKALGEGWRLPTDEEWKALAKSYGGYFDWDTGKEVKNPEKSYQALIKGGKSGLAILFGGNRGSDGDFESLEREGYYWSDTKHEEGFAWGYEFDLINQQLSRRSDHELEARSCRCIKD